MGVLDLGCGRMGDGCYFARNLDNRAGCAVLVHLLERLAAEKRELPFGLVMNFSVAEEVGLRGAQAAAFDLAPDLALAVESTIGETPGVEAGRNPSRLGGGPAITVADGRIVVPQSIVDSLEAGGQAGRGGLSAQAAPLWRHRRRGHPHQPGRGAHRGGERAHPLHPLPGLAVEA